MVKQTDNSQLRVVVIDDDQTVLLAATAVLEGLGLQAFTFDNPVDALADIGKNGASIVVSDICMPGHDGFAVLKEVKRCAPSCDVVFITAHGDMDMAVRALREGATDLVQKPLTATALRAALERTRRYHSLSMEKRGLETQVKALATRIQELTRVNSTLIGDSQAMRSVGSQIDRIAQVDVTVLITGESGTGKELAALAVHAASPRSDESFIPVNCASIPADLFESEMFGHRRGAFTGAVEGAKGFVNAAEKGTLFLDEIGDLPAGSQAKILRLLEQKTYTRVGDPIERQADVRILAATNQNLEKRVEQGRFRRDLYYRLAVCHILMPPLRDHKSDIPTLALFFALQAASSMGKSIESLSADAVQTLMAYHFPGNVRELRNIMERSVIFADHVHELQTEHLPALTMPSPTGASPSQKPDNQTPQSDLSMEKVERQLYTEALSRTGHNVSAAARILGVSRGKLRRRLAALDIRSSEA
jgi:two-component system response regulator AtoC